MAQLAMHPLIAAAAGALDATTVPWCFLRGADELTRPAGDQDLLIARGSGPTVDAALAGAGFLRLRVWADGGQRFHLGYDDGGAGSWVHLHVVDRLAFGDHAGLEFATAGDAALQRRRAERGPWTLDPADEFWVTLLHALLDKARVKDAHRLRLADLARGDDRALLESPVALAWMAEGNGDPVAILALVRSAAWRSLEAKAPEVCTTWQDIDPLARTRRSRNVRSLRRRKAIEPFTERGLQVALLAPDGAGKSTVARLVVDRFFFDARTSYLGLYGAANPVVDLPIPGAGLVQRLGRSWARWGTARYHQARRRLVVFDRHPYDARLEDPSRPIGRAAAVRRAVLGRALPAPDLVVVLDAPGQVLFDRKGEHDPALLERRRQAYLKLAGSLRRAEVVDATGDPDRVASAVTAAIWRRYLARQAGR